MGRPLAGQVPGGGVAYPASTACTAARRFGQERRRQRFEMHGWPVSLGLVPALSQPLPPPQYPPFGWHSEITRTAAKAQVA